YTKQIQDTSAGTYTSGSYPNRVQITYDTRTNFQHTIATITDTTGRTINFKSCEWAGGHCSATTSQLCNVNSQCPGGETCQQTPPPADQTTAPIDDMCIPGSKAPAAWSASDRSTVATYSVDLPGFGQNAGQLTSPRVTYGFMYQNSTLGR